MMMFVLWLWAIGLLIVRRIFIRKEVILLFLIMVCCDLLYHVQQWLTLSVSVVIWKMQDKICQHKSPSDSEENLHKLYSEVIEADRELRAIMSKMPAFLKGDGDSSSELPPHIEQQRAVLSLGLAHKVCTPAQRYEPSSDSNVFASSTQFTATFKFPVSKTHGLHIQRYDTKPQLKVHPTKSDHTYRSPASQ